jgi:hypothetical protein
MAQERTYPSGDIPIPSTIPNAHYCREAVQCLNAFCKEKGLRSETLPRIEYNQSKEQNLQDFVYLFEKVQDIHQKIPAKIAGYYARLAVSPVVKEDEDQTVYDGIFRLVCCDCNKLLEVLDPEQWSDTNIRVVPCNCGDDEYREKYEKLKNRLNTVLHGE